MAGSEAIASPVTMDTSRTYSSDPGVPPVASRQHQRSQPHPTPSAALLIPPPHQGAPGTLAYALTDPPAHPLSLPQVRPRRGTVGHPHTRSDVHPHLHAVHSPPFAFPRHMGLPRQENMRYLAYVPHAPVYQYRTPPDLVPTPPHHFPPTASAPSSPMYPHTLNNTSPPPNSLSPPRHTMSGPSGSAHHSPPYVMHSAYTPMGYTTHPSYVYPPPASFVPALYTYGPHSPHYSRPYDFPPGQESQGTWWYPHPGATVVANSSEGTQHEFQPQLVDGYPPPGQPEGEHSGQRNAVPLLSETQPTRRTTTQIRTGRFLNAAKQEAPQVPPPTSPTSPRTRHQERRSYHPNPPANRSEWVMWAGNVPSDVKRDELRGFFNEPLLRPLSSTSTEPAEEDGQQLYGGVSSVFIISRSNCAFVNFESEAQLEAAMVRFNGQPIRPHDLCCPPLVCRVRRREDALMAGVGGQRGSGMHIKWLKEHKAKVQRIQADTVGSQKDMMRSSSPLSVSSDDSRGRGEGRFTNTNISRSASIASTSSDILTRYFPQRYFVLKSLTQVCISPFLNPQLSQTHTLAVRSGLEHSEEYVGNSAPQRGDSRPSISHQQGRLPHFQR
jgi:hypothetical protein